MTWWLSRGQVYFWQGWGVLGVFDPERGRCRVVDGVERAPPQAGTPANPPTPFLESDGGAGSGVDAMWRYGASSGHASKQSVAGSSPTRCRPA